MKLKSAGSAICEFKRYERKYLITVETRDMLLSLIAHRLVPDKYCEGGKSYRIFNLYVDTPDYSVIRQSSAKPSFKEKVRFRGYSNYFETGNGYLEIKRKIHGIVIKRRIACTEAEAVDFMEHGVPPKCDDVQKIREFARYFSVNKVMPKAYVAYDRVAYSDSVQPDVRVTFDSNMLYRTTALTFEEGDFGESLLPSGFCVLEIKFTDSMPLWLARAIGECKIYPHSFSKYGEAYKKEIHKRLLEGIA